MPPLGYICLYRANQVLLDANLQAGACFFSKHMRLFASLKLKALVLLNAPGFFFRKVSSYVRSILSNTASFVKNIFHKEKAGPAQGPAFSFKSRASL